jgi:hypothetical protein
MQVKIQMLDQGAVVYGNPEGASMRRIGAFSTVEEAVMFAQNKLREMVENYPQILAEQERRHNEMRARMAGWREAP